MADVTADLFGSLDGYALGVDVGPYFGYGGPEVDRWVRDALDRPQLILMGRVTYEAVAQSSSIANDEVSTRMTQVTKAVSSNTLHEPLEWSNTRLVWGDLAEQVDALKRQSDDPIRTIGSLRLVRSLLRLGLVDRPWLAVFPLILGEAGREPIFAGYARTSLDLVETAVLDSRVVMLEYAPR